MLHSYVCTIWHHRSLRRCYLLAWKGYLSTPSDGCFEGINNIIRKEQLVVPEYIANYCTPTILVPGPQQCFVFVNRRWWFWQKHCVLEEVREESSLCGFQALEHNRGAWSLSEMCSFNTVTTSVAKITLCIAFAHSHYTDRHCTDRGFVVHKCVYSNWTFRGRRNQHKVNPI